MEPNEQEMLHARIQGRVQGVGFRHFVLIQANQQGLVGWVRNRRNGDVEVIAEGQRPELDKLLQYLHRGPPSAYVTDVHTQWGKATGNFVRFNVRATE